MYLEILPVFSSALLTPFAALEILFAPDSTELAVSSLSDLSCSSTDAISAQIEEYSEANFLRQDAELLRSWYS